MSKIEFFDFGDQKTEKEELLDIGDSLIAEDEKVVKISAAEKEAKRVAKAEAEMKQRHDSMVEGVRYVDMKDNEGNIYQVKVTSYKPELNPLELINPVFVHGSNT